MNEINVIPFRLEHGSHECCDHQTLLSSTRICGKLKLTHGDESGTLNYVMCLLQTCKRFKFSKH